MSNTTQFLQLIKHPFKFKLFMLSKLPSAFFCGVRVVDADENKCSVKVPYKWFSQNPFKSTYFACLSMAAEMSTGLLCLMHLHKRQPAVSMLVVKMEGNFMKKATGITVFTCEDGNAIKKRCHFQQWRKDHHYKIAWQKCNRRNCSRICHYLEF